MYMYNLYLYQDRTKKKCEAHGKLCMYMYMVLFQDRRTDFAGGAAMKRTLPRKNISKIEANSK